DRRQPVHLPRHREDPRPWVAASAPHPAGRGDHPRLPGGQWLAAGRATFVKVVVQGLWHLGTVTAACVAAAGLETVGLDTDPEVVAELGAGRPPLLEPGLAELVADGLAAGRLRFTRDPAEALADADVLWVCHDTPVDE